MIASLSWGERKPSRRLGRGERQPRLARRGLAVEERGLDPVEVVGRALGLAAAAPGHDRAVARAHQLLQLGLGVAQRAGGGVGGLGAERVRLVARDARQAQGRRARSSVASRRSGEQVEVVGVGVVEAGGHVLPVVAQGRRQLLLRGHGHEAVGGQQVEHLAEAVDRQHVGHVRALGLLAGGGRRDLGQLAVLGRQLRRRLDGHPLDLLQRALGERGEEREPLDLHVEQLAAHRALLGGGVDVHDVAAQGELAALLHLVDALVAARHELRRRSRRGPAARPSRS